LAAEDRCHLNGMAIEDGRPRYVTALGATDSPNGWRPRKPDGGVLIDVPSGQTLAGGLSMPHSPRLHEGSLWLLESGTGRLLRVDSVSGEIQVVAVMPGFARGLALVGPYAFVGLSRIRDGSAMDGVPLAEHRSDLKCGVAAVDLRSGLLAGLLEFHSAVEEIYDVQVLPGLRFPEVIGFQQDAVCHTFIVPGGRQSPSEGRSSS
jgi:uncharacterized protein (TIGR03032 family)